MRSIGDTITTHLRVGIQFRFCSFENQTALRPRNALTDINVLAIGANSTPSKGGASSSQDDHKSRFKESLHPIASPEPAVVGSRWKQP
jgi:hypothetical protein